MKTDWNRATPATLDELPTGRRAFLQGLGAFAVLALVREARAAGPVRALAPARWVDAQQDLAQALMAGTTPPRAWMAGVEGLAREVDVAELMAYLDTQRVTDAPGAAHNDPRKRFVRFLDADGEPRRLAYGAALFDFAPRNVITPHGHRHMASAHLVVAGRLRVRTFDRVGDEPGAMLVRPSGDAVAGVGTLSAMSSERDNIHWFVPQGGPATTFDVVVSDLDPGQPSYEIRAIDPLGGTRGADGTIRAPILDFGAASAKYTADL